MDTWRHSRLIAALIIGAFVVLQLSLPLTRLGDEGDRRFGWQMYSDTDAAPEFVIVTSEGTEEAVDLERYLAVVRVEADLARHLPPFICSLHENAATVSSDGGSYRC